MMQTQENDSPSVLFVDDEPRVLTSMRAMFRRDYNVLLANSGQEAIDLLKQYPVDVIVSDQRMPGMTGVEVLNQVKEIAPTAVRILLTGYADLDAIEASINESEVFRYLTKPCPQEELKEVVALAAQASLEALEHKQAAFDIPAFTPAGVHPSESPKLSVVGSADITGTAEPASFDDQNRGSGVAAVQQAMREVADENVQLLLLSRDALLIEAMEKALNGTRVLHTSSSVEQAVTVLEQNPVGVLVTDTAINEDAIQELTTELKRHVPQLVTIIASDRSDAQTLISLINYGQIFRFLLKPIQGGQCRIWIQSAVKKHLELVSVPGAQRYHRVATKKTDTGDSGSLLHKVHQGILNIGDRFGLKVRKAQGSNQE